MLKQTSLTLADDARWDWLYHEFAPVLSILEEAGVKADLLTFADIPNVCMLILERDVFVASMRIVRFPQKRRAVDTGCAYFSGFRYPSGVHTEQQESDRSQFLTALGKQFQPARRAAA